MKIEADYLRQCAFITLSFPHYLPDNWFPTKHMSFKIGRDIYLDLVPRFVQCFGRNTPALLSLLSLNFPPVMVTYPNFRLVLSLF